MEIQIHANNMLVIKVDLNKVIELVKLQPGLVTEAAKESLEAIAEALPAPSEDDILGGEAVEPTVEAEAEVIEEAPVKSKPTAKVKPEPKKEVKVETKKAPATKAEPKKVEAKKETPKAEPKAEPKKVEAKPEPKKEAPKAVKYNRLDVKHREAFSAIIESTLGKDWKVADATRNKVGDFSREAHDSMAFLGADGKVCAEFTAAFAKYMGV